MLRPDDELPPPVRFRSAPPSLLHGAAALVATVALIYAAVFLYRWATEPIVLTSASPSTSGPPSSPVSFPPELLQMAVAVSTSLAPTTTPAPTPEPSPTYVMLPTPPPPDICLTSTPRGSVCTQPLAPKPTNTPMADCPVSPGESCVWRGGSVQWLSPTPTWAPNMTSGSVNNQ